MSENIAVPYHSTFQRFLSLFYDICCSVAESGIKDDGDDKQNPAGTEAWISAN